MSVKSLPWATLAESDSQGGEKLPGNASMALLLLRLMAEEGIIVSVLVLNGNLSHAFTVQKLSQFYFFIRIGNVFREWEHLSNVTSQTCKNSNYIQTFDN